MANEAVVVGSGPNGLAAAITLALRGLSVTVIEANPTFGGGARSAEITLPGCIHDLCSAVHPLASASPFFRSLPLREHGLRWVHPPACLAHPLDDGTAVLLEPSLARTAAGLGTDGAHYRRLMQPFVQQAPRLLADVLGPVLRWPRHPLLLARFGLWGLLPGRRLAELRFRGQRARALLAGLAAHSARALEQPLSAAVGLLLGVLGHAAGWPLAAGGSQRITDALASSLRALGGHLVANRCITDPAALGAPALVLWDLTPRQLLRILGARLPARYRRRLARYRYGAGAFKLDYALDGPIPWTAAACGRAGTVHLGGTLEEIAASEAAVRRGAALEHPFVLLAQPTLFDSTRAPAGKQIVWAYCHVPNGSAVDMTVGIEAQIERFAPGFRNRILARHVLTPAALEGHNANYIGGDINGGMQDVRQFLARPVLRRDPYALPVPGMYLCSASTPPGGGVHGMCGYHAARAALRARGMS